MDRLRRVVAVLIALRALTNFGKPFVAGSRFVVVGHLMGGVASAVVAPLFGLAMVRPWARPGAVAYALWATVNVVLFPVFEPIPTRFPPWSYALFAVPGVAVPWLAVWLLGRPPEA
jgi:hypothetical protein